MAIVTVGIDLAKNVFAAALFAAPVAAVRLAATRQGSSNGRESALY
jgi:hypothetical protein